VTDRIAAVMLTVLYIPRSRTN